MKKSFLPIMMVLMSQSTIFCMEITPKTIKSSTMQSHAMTYPLKNGTEIIVSPDAVALCQQLNFSKEDFDLLFAGKKLGVIPFTFDLSDDEAVIFFKILNTISQDATKTMDGGYVTQHVYTIVNNALHNVSNESLARRVGVF